MDNSTLADHDSKRAIRYQCYEKCPSGDEGDACIAACQKIGKGGRRRRRRSRRKSRRKSRKSRRKRRKSRRKRKKSRRRRRR